MNKVILIFFFLLFSFTSFEKSKKDIYTSDDYKSKWVDSIYNQMTLHEKVGQLFMVATYSNRTSKHTDSIRNFIKKYHIGGLIFFQGGPVRQSRLINTYQSMSKVPLIIGIDAEWGLNMRLDSTVGYPYNMTLGAIQNNELVKKIGKQIGLHNKRLGVHINFAPVVDINTNPKNPIIGVRSFGEEKLNVTNKAIAYMEGLQSEGVLACAKHFPGHGDTDSDSHKTLPTVSFSAERIDSVELYPYKQLIEKGLASVMVGHLNVPSLEKSDQLPASLSFNIISNILKDRLAFQGLILTDALNMKGVSNYLEPGDVDLAAFKAGNDLLLYSENCEKAIAKIVNAYNDNEISEERLKHSVKKILGVKFDAELNKLKPIEISSLISDLNKEKNSTLYEEAISNAITVVKNESHILPLNLNSYGKTAYIKLGDGKSFSFSDVLQENINIDEISGDSLNDLLKKLKKYDKVIIGYHRENSRQTQPISAEDKQLIEKVAYQNKVILVAFASQYCLNEVILKNVKTIVVSFENSEFSQQVSAQILLGKMDAIGKLPSSINEEFKVGTGL